MRQFWVLVLVLSAGCSLSSRIREEIRQSREKSYEDWLASREGKSSSRPLLHGGLSVEQAILVALQHSRKLEITLLEKQKARGMIIEAWAGAIPSIRLTANYTRLDKVSSFSAGPATVTVGDVNNISVVATLTQPLYRGGAIGAGIRAAKIYRYLTDERIRETVQEVIYDASKAYYNVLLFEELEKASAEGVRVAEAHLREVIKRRDLGVATDFDVLRAEVELANLKAQNIQDSNRLRLALASLLNILGVCQESKVNLSDRLEYAEVTASAEEAIREALLTHPKLLAMELMVSLRRESVRTKKAGGMPTADVSFEDTHSRPDPHSITAIRWGEAWKALLTFSAPLFDGFRTKGRLKQELALLGQEKVKLRDAEEGLLLAIHSALASLEDAKRFYESQQANLHRAEEALRLVEAGYRAGVNTELEVLDSRRALIQARAHYFRSIHDYIIAQLDLKRASGTIEPPSGWKLEEKK